VDDGRLMKDHYVAHVDVGNSHPHHRSGGGSGEGDYQRAGTAQGDNVILLTVSRILFIRTVKMKVAWEVLLSDLSSISLESEGIALILRGNIAGPFLPLRDVGSRNWLFKQVSFDLQCRVGPRSMASNNIHSFTIRSREWYRVTMQRINNDCTSRSR
jgi:vacuolar protein sorting-associated protein 13A/C